VSNFLNCSKASVRLSSDWAHPTGTRYWVAVGADPEARRPNHSARPPGCCWARWLTVSACSASSLASCAFFSSAALPSGAHPQHKVSDY
jgi:hypothetical protein